MRNYDAKEIEKKWQKYWKENNIYRTLDKVDGKENFYTLSEFAYPSGNLHVGHWYAFAVPDIYARFKRMSGYNVLYPMGFDAFGLPAENAAIKRGLDPKKWTYENMDYMRKQLASMGASFDWERSFATSDPEYYKWTQWMFTQFYKNGLVEQITTKANWCDSCKTVLANEQVVAGKCERCDSEVVQKDMQQWAFKITDFADELTDDLDELDWDESIKQAQREWIGRKEGSEISFEIICLEKNINKKNAAIYQVIEKSIDVSIKDLEKFGELEVVDDFGDWGLFYKIQVPFESEDSFINFMKEHLLEKNPDGGSWYIDSAGTTNKVIFRNKVIDPSTKEGLQEFYKYGEKIGLPAEQLDIVPMARSFLIGSQNISDDDLDSLGIRVIKNVRGTDRNILIPVESIDDYESLIKEKMENGFWNEYIIGDKVIFIFKGDDGKTEKFVLDKSNESLILKKAKKFADKNFDSIYSMLNNNPFYTGYIKKDDNKKINVFTTRADTLFGVTYIVLAPEHELVQELKTQIENWDEVKEYLEKTKRKSDLERQQSKEKTGVFLKGIKAINPATHKEIPVLVADYVLAHFGTGAVMAVPAHDERDAEFALKFDLPFKFVVLPSAGEIGNSRPLVTYGENAFIKSASETLKTMNPKATAQEIINAEWNAMYDLLGTLDDGVLPKGKQFCCTFKGKLINAKEGFNAITTEGAIPKITEFVEGKMKKTYRLRDWGISRQRYWGTPIPIVYNNKEKEEIINYAHNISFYCQEAWGRLISGFKTIETRALNPEEKNRYFGDFKVGEYLRAINRETNEEKYFLIKKIWLIDNLEELLKYPDVIEKIYAPKEPAKTIDDLINSYSFTYDYVDRINKNGLVAWEVEMITPGVKTISDEHLPWLLPEDVDHTPDGTAPLARSQELKERTEKIFGEGWTPEVDTMDAFVDSSWYFYRYLDNKNENEFASKEILKNWMPIDMYFGGAAHTTMHLLYSRFWTKALRKIGLVDKKEPYKMRINRGLIMSEDGTKMSKSKGNTVDPDEVVAHVGADTVRMYLAFIGPFNEPGNYPWDPNGVVGVRRFIERMYSVCDVLGENSSQELLKLTHKTIKKVSEDVERLKLNTAISSMMVWVNKAEKEKEVGKTEYESIIKMFATFAPHISEEIWQNELEYKESIHLAEWPKYDEKFARDDEKNLPVQVNGKVRAQLLVSLDIEEEKVRELALALTEIQKWTEGKEIKKFIYVKGRIVNIVF